MVSISDCLVVVESAEKGGAMVTARIASDYDRDVFALPGRTSDIYSAGCNSLIRRNVASLVGSADDLIDAMRCTPDGSRRPLSRRFSLKSVAKNSR